MDAVSKTTATCSDPKSSAQADRLIVTYYTDPLCCWSWAMEESWRKFKSTYGPLLHWRYVMGGMIENWKTYNDPINSISKPAQFGPVWMHASQISGVKIDGTIWHKNPPTSSFPSCIAVKCAGLQSPEAEDQLLAALRSAVMTQGRNISDTDVISEIASGISNAPGGHLDYNAWKNAWTNRYGVEPFRNDLRHTRFLKIGRFPTLTITTPDGEGILMTGYRPYDQLSAGVDHMLKTRNPP